ncbi:elongation factor G [Papillibacter cinnamivorans]|uniref:Elongation factor G n=1 Tax=Papillibacter cinnamivorans DSM 12816 TaxID=1122930 RepID=A0A1W2BWA5_9FIRM|nr:elongation factor G [Papillibacter cinnamivorans]SMC77024.1 elongation factor G [Papillibacter cinnamivorans DSM 12816]
MSYSAQNIRNVCLLGHGGSGKTSLAESVLFLTNGTDRLGKVADGNTVSDFDAEEIKRQISISLTALPVEYGGYKLNLLDTPGYFDFAGETAEALQVADAGLIVCPAKGGISVGTEKAWKYLQERKLPRAIYISKTDEENGDFNAVFHALREKYGNAVCPVIVPIWNADKRVTGIVDVVRRKAFEVKNGKRVEIDVPADKVGAIDEFYNALMETVAETSEEYMEKFFSGEAFTYEEIVSGLRKGIRDLSLVPVYCGSAVTGLGTLPLLDGLVSLFPSPLERPAVPGTDAAGEPTEVAIDPNGPACALVFKTVSDQYGKFSFFKVISGCITTDLVMTNARTGGTEKMGHIFFMKGKKSTEVKEICCGDIGAVAKLNETKTGDTLCDSKRVVSLAPIPFAEPCYSMAIFPKVKGQEDKISSGLQRLSEEDPSFSVVNNGETKQMVVTGAGDIQLDVLCSKLKNRFGVDAELQPARVAYREKIRKKVKVQGRHKKQSGGHGQFGDVWIEFEPGDTEELTFTENIFGGSVPKNFHPAVEKGLRESVQRGVLAGYPVVFLKATLVDGSYHPVDSSEMAFKTAASLAYKAGLPQAGPVLLEPIGSLKVTVPDSYMGDIIGDLNKRRGRVMGMNPTGTGDQVVEAEVPMAEMGSYAIDLRSMTQGRGSFSFNFVRYEETPPAIQQKVIEDAKATMDQGE